MSKLVEEIDDDALYKVDLTRAETIAALRYVCWRKREQGGVEIEYRGRWLHLCRTDLADDVRTHYTSWGDDDVETLNFYVDRVAYGARITDDAFFVIDSFSDG